MSFRFQAGQVVSRALSILGKNLLPFLLLTTLVYTPVLVLIVAGVSGIDDTVSPLSAGLFVGLIGLLAFVLNFVASASVMYGVLQQLRGQHANIGDSLRMGLRRILPVLGTALLMSLCIGLGLIALLVPGIILILMFYVAIPATVMEGCGPIDALKRSAELTKGYKADLFGVVLLAIIIGFVIELPVELLSEALPGLAGALFEFAGSVLSGAVSAVITAVAYHDLRVTKEGADIEDLVRVFE
ncbi:hypothetical protein [Haliangium ochraceum]|uniref:DUF7847 domain-containing protein n=1 Tax=Haliangium ochraceum (strain DSM 14365 / JCM 11303 / SMP-2) TaxID=502025 RepID=D0LSD3_HALO1|nr:hypothetical protein [Haliangium ochraceum]ACY15632.1 conserved hypothetical protein [Haliangium ochraceum DSM 14365]